MEVIMKLGGSLSGFGEREVRVGVTVLGVGSFEDAIF